MPVLYDSADSNLRYASSTPTVASLTVADNPNRIIIWSGHAGRDSPNHRYATFTSSAGTCVTLTSAYRDNGEGTVQLYIGYILNPTIGAQTVTQTPTDSQNALVSAISLYNVSPEAPTVSQSGTNTTSISLTGMAGGMLIAAHGDQAPTSVAQGAGETSRWTGAYNDGDNRFDFSGRGSTKVADGGAQAMARASIVDVLLACAVDPLVSGDQVIWIMFERMKKFYEDLRRGLIPPQDLLRRRREVFI